MKLVDVSKAYGENVVFDHFNFEIENGKITAILGASGSGKTTLLNIIAQLTEYSGTVEGKAEKVSYMFQSARLLPNLTVYKNMEYVLKSVCKKDELKNLIDNYLAKVELTEKAEGYPSELSGGMLQRVSLARAFAYPSELLLMDEPFVGLDVALKKRIIGVFDTVYKDDGRTVIFVTHDIEDAVMLADRLVVLKKRGEIVADIDIDVERGERNLSVLGETISSVYSAI